MYGGDVLIAVCVLLVLVVATAIILIAVTAANATDPPSAASDDPALDINVTTAFTPPGGFTEAGGISILGPSQSDAADRWARQLQHDLQAGFLHDARPAHTSTTQSARSTNWAGYVSTSVGADVASVLAAYGEWTVPTLSSVGVTDAHTYSSLWVGLDGWSNGVVEQIGTDHELISGVQVNFVWFEFYPAQPYEIHGFPCAPGDVMGASVRALAGRVFDLVILNFTTMQYYRVPYAFTVSRAALRTSAEWICEAPWLDGVLPLANFGTVEFQNCSAEIGGGGAGSINDDRWINTDITMETQDDIVKCATGALTDSGHAFTCTWLHS